MRTPPRPLRRSLLPAIVILASTFAAYVPAMQGGYIWDDDHYVSENPLLTEPGGLRRIWGSAVSLWTSLSEQSAAPQAPRLIEDADRTPQYYPLVFTTFWVEARLWGLNRPAGFHAVNVALHGLAAVLVWRLLLRLGLPGAWLAAAVFALHPVHVESVAWITERKNVLSAVLYLLAFVCYLRFEDRWQLRWYVMAVALYVLALLSKTVTCSLPVAILLVAWLRHRRIGTREVAWLVPLFGVGAAMAYLTAWYEKHYVGAAGTEWNLSLAQHVILACRALCFYAGKLFWPVRLTFIYPRWQIDAASVAQWLWVLAAAGAGVGAWLLRRRAGRGPLVALLFFAATLVPALGFVDVYPMRYSFVADHFQYLASLGIIVLCVSGASHVARAIERPVVPAVGAVLLCVLAALTWQQGHIYRDLETLWRDTLAKNDGAWMAHNNLGVLLARRGETDRAIARYRRSLEIEPDNAEALFNLGRVLIDDGQLAEAVRSLRRAVQVLPPAAPVHNELGRALALSGRENAALEEFKKALQIDERYAEAHINLANTLARRGQTQEAIGHYERAIRLRPDEPLAYDNLGHVLTQARRYDEAIRFVEQGLAESPSHSGLAARLAWLLAASPADSDRDGARAVTLGESACRASGSQEPRALDAAAAAYAEVGRFADAVRAAAQAAGLARRAGHAELAAQIETRLRLYRAGQPFRLPP